MLGGNDLRILKIIICYLITLLLFTSCSVPTSSTSHRTAKEQCDEIVRCFNEKDTDALKSMFCNTVVLSKSTDIEQQIENVYILFDNEKIVSYEIISGSESRSEDKGEVTKLEIYPIIRPAILSNDDEYEIYFYSYIVDKENCNNEGISEITICDKNDNEYKIGNVRLVHSNL